MGFGQEAEEFVLLQELSKVLPHGKFQKLGLSADGLASMLNDFSTTVSSATNLAAHQSTPFKGRKIDGGASSTLYDATKFDKGVLNTHEWDIYLISQSTSSSVREIHCKIRGLNNLMGKRRFMCRGKAWVSAPYEQGANGIAVSNVPFGTGSEREAFQCSEILIPLA